MYHQENIHFPGGLLPPEGCTAEQLLKAIFDNDHGGLIVVNKGGLVTQISKSIVNMLTINPINLIGQPVYEITKYGYFNRLVDVYKSGKPEYARMENINGHTILVDYVPLQEKNKLNGVLVKVTMVDYGSIQDKNVAGKRKKTSRYTSNIQYTVDHIIGSSPQIIDLKETLMKISPRNSTVLVTGDSGTGKELFAQSIHAASLRRSGPFVKINCAAIPDALLESEFFGYEEGAFTGARRGGQVGKFEIAHGGSVFLDEIGDLSFSLQAKLLRFIQNKEIQKLGSNETVTVDVRIVAATNVNLEQLVKYKKFREDLYYRLNVVNLNIPSLRERKEDIPELVERFIHKFNKIFNFSVKGMSPEVEAIFKRYAWPGNIRELENVIERAYNIMEGNIILPSHLPQNIGVNVMPLKGMAEDGNNYQGGYVISALQKGQTLDEIMDQSEKNVLVQALILCKGNKARASQMLGISRPGLYKKLSKLGMT